MLFYKNNEHIIIKLSNCFQSRDRLSDNIHFLSLDAIDGKLDVRQTTAYERVD